MNEKLYEKKSHGSLLFPFQHYRMVTEQTFLSPTTGMKSSRSSWYWRER